MMGGKGAMKDAVLLMKEANALQTRSVCHAMESARCMTGSDRYTTSTVRDITDTVPRMKDGVALMNDPTRRMMSPNRHMKDAMPSVTGPVRAEMRPRLSVERATRPTMGTMRLQTVAIAGKMRAIAAVMPPSA